MALFNLDMLSLMAYAGEDIIAQWRNEVIQAERNKAQRLDSTRYTKSAHRDSHTNTAHIDRYTKAAEADIYSRSAAVDIYSRTAARDTYTQVAARDTYTQVAARDTYSRVAHTDTYSRVAHVDRYTDSYSRAAHRDSYSNSYSRAAHRDSYSRTARRDSYTRSGYSKTTYSRKGGRGYYRGGRYTRYNNGSYVHSDNHRNRYSRAAHTDSYSRSAHRDSYSNSYSRSAHRDRYSRDYSRTAKRDTYSKVAHTDTYSRVAHSNTYTRVVHSNEYGRVAHTDGYSRRAHTDTYSRGSHGNLYSNEAARDTYSNEAAVSRGFDHENYIPSTPELYNLDGQVISGELEVRLASYDKNGDGFGSQDADSIDIYYRVEMRQIQDILGNAKVTDWKVLQEGAKTDEFDVSLSGYADGMYEVRSTAYNLPRSENGVSKTYVSDEKICSFMIVSGQAGQDITILNAAEFSDYIYGIETYVTTSDEVKKYVDSIIYSKSDNQKGLFLEIGLEDEDADSYHKTKVSLEKDGNEITGLYDVIYETDGGKPKSGDKTGVVFIPLLDMLDDGSFEDVKIHLETEEFRDSGFTKRLGTKTVQYGLNEAKDVVYIDVDGEKPEAFVSDPSVKKVLKEDVQLTFSDTGLGLRKKEYRILKKGETGEAWQEAPDTSQKITLDEAGEYTVYARATDRAGNVSEAASSTFRISYADQKLKLPESVIQGGTFTARGNTESDLAVEKTEFWIQDRTEAQVGNLVSSESSETEGRLSSVYDRAIKTPEDIPLGTHVVFMKVIYEDGITKTVSETIDVTDSQTSVITPVESDKDKNDVKPFLIKNDKEEDTLVIQKGDRFTPLYYQKTVNSDGEDISDRTTCVSHVPLKDGKAETPGEYDVIYTSVTGKNRTEFTLHVIVNDPPVIASSDVFLFDGDVSKSEILKRITVTDREDGKIKLKEDDLRLSKNEKGGYDVLITAADSMKGKTKKTILLKTIGTALAKEGPRFINRGSFGSLTDDSIWTEDEYRTLLERSLDRSDPVYERHIDGNSKEGGR